MVPGMLLNLWSKQTRKFKFLCQLVSTRINEKTLVGNAVLTQNEIKETRALFHFQLNR